MSDHIHAGQLVHAGTRRPCPPWCALPRGHAWELETIPPDPMQVLRYHEAPLVLEPPHLEVYLTSQEVAALTADGSDVYGLSQVKEPRLSIYLSEAPVDVEQVRSIAALLSIAADHLEGMSE